MYVPIVFHHYFHCDILFFAVLSVEKDLIFSQMFSWEMITHLFIFRYRLMGDSSAMCTILDNTVTWDKDLPLCECE